MVLCSPLKDHTHKARQTEPGAVTHRSTALSVSPALLSLTALHSYPPRARHFPYTSIMNPAAPPPQPHVSSLNSTPALRTSHFLLSKPQPLACITESTSSPLHPHLLGIPCRPRPRLKTRSGYSSFPFLSMLLSPSLTYPLPIPWNHSLSKVHTYTYTHTYVHTLIHTCRGRLFPQPASESWFLL